MKILIANSHEKSRQVIENMLGNDVFELFYADSGREALNMYKNISPDIVILEAELPDLNGIDICGKIREIRGNSILPFVIVTSNNAKPDTMSGCICAGAIDFLKLPGEIIVMEQKLKIYKEIIGLQRQINNISTGIPDSGEAEKKEQDKFDEAKNLTFLEHKLLKYMTKNKNTFLPREKIIRAVWEDEYVKGSDRVVDLTICRLKKKVPAVIGKIECKKGFGYILKEK